MADNIAITAGSGTTVAADDIGGVKHQRVKVSVGADGEAADLDFGQSVMATSLPVTVSSDQSAIPVSGPLTDTQLRASAVTISDGGASVTVDGPVTDTQLRASPVPVSGTVTATGPLTDTQLRAAPVPVSGTVTASGPLTDTQLRASAVPVSGTITAVGAITNALPAGTNAIGKLAANSGVDIGDVDVLSLPALPAGTNAIGKLTANSGVDIGDVDILSIAAGDNNIGNVDIASIAAGETLIGLVGASDIAVTVTPTCDTNAYASGDLIFDATEIAAAVRANAGHCILQSVHILDKADQGVALSLVFANAATDFGTLNSAPDPDDTEAATVIGFVPVATTDYIDLGASKVATIRNIGLGMKAGASTTSLYVAAINGTGTPTFGASDLVLTFYFLRA